MTKGNGQVNDKIMRIPRNDFEKLTGTDEEFDGAEVENLIEGDIREKT